MTASTKHWLPVKLITTKISVNRMAAGEYTGGSKCNISKEMWREGSVHGLSGEINSYIGTVAFRGLV
jgi:hypothetical protein